MVIYKITNLLNNKVYIGQTVKSAAARFANRRYYLRKNWHHNEHIQRAWNKYGKDVFTFEVIESVLDMNIIDDRERYWIKLYDATNPSMGYNSESAVQASKDLKICRKALIKNCKGLRGNIKGYSFLFFEGNK